MADKIEIEIELDPKLGPQAQKKIVKQAGKAGDKSGKKFSKQFSGEFKRSTKFLFAGIGIGAITAIIGIRKLIRSSKEFVQLAGVQQDAVNELNSSLKRSGKFTVQASKDFQDFASQLQQNSTIGDEVILKNAALIQSLGALSTEGLKQATQAAADLAAALGIDLTAAATLVGKAAVGEVGSFSRYGLVIKKGKTAAETFAKALTALQAKFGGAAQAQTKTFTGALEQLNNTFGDLKETVGEIITNSPAIVNLFKFLSKEILKVQNSLKGLNQEGDIVGNILISFLDLNIKVIERMKNSYDKVMASLVRFKKQLIQIATITAVIVVITEMISGLAALKGIAATLSITTLPSLLGVLTKLGPKGLLVAGAIGAATGAVALFNKVIKESAAPRDLGEKLAFTNSKITETANLIGDYKRKLEELKALGPVDPGIAGIFEIKIGEAESDLKSYNNVFKETMKAMAGEDQPDPEAEPNSILNIIKRIREALSKPLPKIKLEVEVPPPESITDATNAIVINYKGFFDRLNKITIDVGSMLNKGLGTVVAGSIQKLAQNLADGKSIFDDFGTFVLGLIGDLAIQIGTFIIGAAIAKAALFGPVGLGVAAGAALIVTGILIKSLVGGGGSAPATSTGGGGGGVGGTVSDEIIEDDAVTETPDTTAVNIVIQGDVLDSEESGLRIANILNDAFDKQGVVIKGAAA